MTLSRIQDALGTFDLYLSVNRLPDLDYVSVHDFEDRVDVYTQYWIEHLSADDQIAVEAWAMQRTWMHVTSAHATTEIDLGDVRFDVAILGEGAGDLLAPEVSEAEVTA